MRRTRSRRRRPAGIWPSWTSCCSIRCPDSPIDVVSQGDPFLVRVTAHDLRPGGDDDNRGVQSAYLDVLFNSAFMTPVCDSGNPQGFAITFGPDYANLQSGRANSPRGVIDEVGGTHSPTPLPPPAVGSEGVGPGQILVFTVLMQATAPTPIGNPVQIVGDPADGNPISDFSEISIMPDDPAQSQRTLTDDQVFLRQSGNLTILGAGEGEFVNHFNPLDVNVDFHVSPEDALIVINTLNASGSGPLNGDSSPGAMVDTNMDSNLSPVDALMVVNYLNSFLSSSASTAAGGGEGESDAEDEASAVDDSLATMSPLDVPSAASGTASPNSSGASKVDASAADDLFASLEAARTQLRNRFRRR